MEQDEHIPKSYISTLSDNVWEEMKKKKIRNPRALALQSGIRYASILRICKQDPIEIRIGTIARLEIFFGLEQGSILKKRK